MQRQSRATAGDHDLQDVMAPEAGDRAAPRSSSFAIEALSDGRNLRGRLGAQTVVEQAPPLAMASAGLLGAASCGASTPGADAPTTPVVCSSDELESMARGKVLVARSHSKTRVAHAII